MALERRRGKPVPQRLIARAVGVSPGTVTAWEIGKQRPMHAAGRGVRRWLRARVLAANPVMQRNRSTPSTGAKIRRYRQERGWTQTELAERVFGDAARQSDISKLERGLRAANMETLQRIADALGVPLAAFGPSPEPSDDVRALRWHLRQMLEILDRME